MTAVLDTSIVLAWYDAGHDHHAAAASYAATLDEELLTTPLAVADLDRALVPAGREALRHDLDAGVWTVRWWADGMRDTLAAARAHPGLDLTTASLLALCRVARTSRVATFDDRFRSLTTPDGQPFDLLPERDERP